MTLGDSKTQGGNWQDGLTVALQLASGLHWETSNGGVSGATVASAAAGISSILALLPDTTDPNVEVLCNWGSNDSVSMPAEATFKANYLAILDAIHAKWPQAKARMTLPWRRGYDANCDTLATWIGAVQASRAWAYIADDERVWMKGADNGATMSVDGIHYSVPTGRAEKIVQARTVLGY